MKIIIFSPTGTIFTLDKSQTLGGADSTLLRMIDYLAEENKVIAFIPIKEKDTSFRGENCQIHPYESIFNHELECDLLIHYRKLWAIPNNIKYKKAIFYSQDTADTPCFNGAKEKEKALQMYNQVWCLSEFHKENLQNTFSIPDEKIYIIGNATEEYKPTEKKRLKFIYCSTPFRGLDVLLRMWIKISAKYPDAELHIYSSMKIYGAEQLDQLQFGKMFNDMKTGRFKNLIWHGSVSHDELMEALQSSFMLLYPNTYPETYCNVIMESRACLTPFITSNLGAIRETGEGAGFFIKGNARTEEYQKEFLSTLDMVIEDPEIYKMLQDNCYPVRTFEEYKKDLYSGINKE